MGDFADSEKRNQWDDWTFDLPFIRSLSTYVQRHPDKCVDRILSDIINFADGDQDYMDATSSASFPARKVLKGLGDLVVLAKVSSMRTRILQFPRL
jgi:hypothetical protein